MKTLQEFIVSEHIDGLRREAEQLRTERRIRQRTRDDDGTRAGRRAQAGSRPARVRLGHWLIGIGLAVSGSAREAH